MIFCIMGLSGSEMLFTTWEPDVPEAGRMSGTSIMRTNPAEVRRAMKLKEMFRTYLSSRMFNRLMLLNSLLILVTFAVILVFVSGRLNSVITEQSIAFNRQVIGTVDAWFGAKCRTAKNTLINLYQDVYASSGAGKTGKDVMSLLRGSALEALPNYAEVKRSTYSYIDANLGKDAGLLAVSIVNAERSASYTTYRMVSNPGTLIMSEIGKREQQPAAAERQKLRFVSTFSPEAASRMFLIYDQIRDGSDLSQVRGYLVFGYGPEIVKDGYKQYRELLKGTLLVLAPDGGVLYDSGGTLYGSAFPLFSEMASKASGTLSEPDRIVNFTRNEEFGFYTVGLVPLADIKAEANSANGMVIAIELAALFVILLFTSANMMRYSRRVNRLIQGIRRIRHGDLSVRTKIGGSDELTDISDNLDQMCGMLDDHIRREYVYRLRQKEAELVTLQAQVNPHFLYNSLEAIRMTALKDGSEDVARMVRLLADLFRGSVKGKIVGTIRDELNSCKAFLEFWNIRWDGRLELVYHIEEEILRYGIPQHLIQPIVENVLVHGIDPTRETNLVVVSGHRGGDEIRISVRDNGSGISGERLAEIRAQLADPALGGKERIGMFNVNQRIRLIFGEEYGVSIDSVEGMGTEVSVRIRALAVEELLKDVQGIAG